MAGKAHADIGVFCDVVGIPPHQFFKGVLAEKQCRSPQWNDEPKPCRSRQYNPSPRCIFNCKATGNPVLAGIIIIKHSLQAYHIWCGFIEPRSYLFNLVGFWRVFGVPSPDYCPAAKVDCVVHGTRFCCQPFGIGDDDHLDPTGQLGAFDGSARDLICGFKDQNNIQKWFGICEIFSSRLISASAISGSRNRGIITETQGSRALTSLSVGRRARLAGNVDKKSRASYNECEQQG